MQVSIAVFERSEYEDEISITIHPWRSTRMVVVVVGVQITIIHGTVLRTFFNIVNKPIDANVHVHLRSAA